MVATKLLATVDELDLLLFDYQHNAIGASVMALIFSNFNFFAASALMKVSKFLLAALVLFLAQRCACQLLLGVCQLTFGMLLSMN